MAKAITGLLSYDPTLDRPTVFLVSGEKRLLTEDDATGGSITSVATGSAAIDVTNPTGPAVVVALDESELENGGAQEISVAGLSGELADPQPPKAHKTSHQNGGSDEISVAGLSGVLDDAQRANVLVETGGPTNLAVGAITDGQFLKRSGSTAVGETLSSMQGAASEFWALPATAHASDVEFNSSTLPAAFTLFNIQTASTATPVVPISGIDVFTQPAAGNVRMEANKSGRRSWLLMQPRGENVRWLYAQKVTLSGNNGWVIRSRFATHIKNLSGANNAAVVRLVLAKDLAGVPHIAAAGAGIQNGMACGWESDGSTMAIEYATVSGGAATSITTGQDIDNLQTVDYEVVYTLRSGAAGVTWDIWCKMAGNTQHVTTFVATALSIGQGDAVWVGWDFVGVDSNMPSSPILSADYCRFENTAAGFIP